MSEPLPTDDQRKALCKMIQAAFVEIRVIAAEGKGRQASDLADVFHNVAMEMWGWGGWDPSSFREYLSEYQAKYHHEHYAAGRDYVAMLDEVFER